MIVNVSKHAYNRGKERLSWRPEVLDKMAEKAFSEGIKHSESKGNLKKYITKVWFRNKTANNIRIHGENIFFFAGNTLVTVYQLPQDLKKYTKL